MKKYLSLLWLMPLFLDASGEKLKEKEQPRRHSLLEELDEMEKGMLESMRSMTQRMEEEFATLTKVFDSTKEPSSFGFQVKDDEEYVIVTLSLPELADKGIEIAAKGNNLEGTFKTKAGGDVKLQVHKGSYLTISYKLESKKEESDDGKEKHHRMLSSSSQSQWLPAAVDNLEETHVSLESGQLTLKLPKHNPKKNWKKITVAP